MLNLTKQTIKENKEMKVRKILRKFLISNIIEAHANNDFLIKKTCNIFVYKLSLLNFDIFNEIHFCT